MSGNGVTQDLSPGPFALVAVGEARELRYAQQQYVRAIANPIFRESQLSEGGLDDLGYRPSHGSRIGNLCG